MGWTIEMKYRGGREGRGRQVSDAGKETGGKRDPRCPWGGLGGGQVRISHMAGGNSGWPSLGSP